MDPEKPTSRRTALKMLGATAAATSLAGCSGVPFMGQSEFEKQKSKMEDAASNYQSPQDAVDDGFTIRGPFSASLGWVATHTDRRDGHTSLDAIDLSKPSVLSYDNEGNLGAVGYHGPASDLGGSPDLFADDDADATEQWSSHEKGTHFMAVPDGEASDPSVEELMAAENWAAYHPPQPDLTQGDTVETKWGPEEVTEERVVDHVVQHPKIVSLWAWVGTENPEGLFTKANPDFAQG